MNRNSCLYITKENKLKALLFLFSIENELFFYLFNILNINFKISKSCLQNVTNSNKFVVVELLDYPYHVIAMINKSQYHYDVLTHDK